jgi:hypothetical protein
MKAKRKVTGLAVGLALLISSNAATNEIYQWTDINNVIHFTDNLSAIPEAARNSSSFVVRRDLPRTPNTPEVRQMPAEPLIQAEATRIPEPIALPSEITAVYAPQDVTIVVVDWAIPPPRHAPCKFGAHCRPVFRPDFNNRQYIHPSVFNGGSRQYVHPSVFNGSSRQHSRRR